MLCSTGVQIRDRSVEVACGVDGNCLERARIETSEGYVRLRAESTVDLAEGIRLLVPAVTS